LAFVFLCPARGWAQEREHFQFRLGATYEQGDFGTSNTSRAIVIPATLKYLGERFDLGVTASFVHLETTGRVTLVDNIPTGTNQQGETDQTAATQSSGPGSRTSASGLGDTLLKGRFYLLKDQGPNSPLPALIAFGKVKIPTADEAKNLGTGEFDYGFGLQWSKEIGRLVLFGEGSYTVIGSPPGRDFRNRPAANVGVGVNLSRTVTVGGLVDWRRALVSTREDPVALIGFLAHRLTPTISVIPSASVGLTKGAPDFGGGVEFVYTFGRY
jgi:hypothetical protein